MTNLLKPFASQSFLVGLGVAAAAYFIGPQLMEAIKPVAVKGAQGMMALSGMAKETMNQGREKIAGAVTEMKEKERAATALSENLGELIKELRSEREQSTKVIEELKNAVIGLKDQINSSMKGESIQETWDLQRN